MTTRYHLDKHASRWETWKDTKKLGAFFFEILIRTQRFYPQGTQTLQATRVFIPTGKNHRETGTQKRNAFNWKRFLDDACVLVVLCKMYFYVNFDAAVIGSEYICLEIYILQSTTSTHASSRKRFQLNAFLFLVPFPLCFFPPGINTRVTCSVCVPCG